MWNPMATVHKYVVLCGPFCTRAIGSYTLCMGASNFFIRATGSPFVWGYKELHTSIWESQTFVWEPHTLSTPQGAKVFDGGHRESPTFVCGPPGTNTLVYGSYTPLYGGTLWEQQEDTHFV